MGPHNGCEPADSLSGLLNMTFADPVVELRWLYRKYVPIIYLKITATNPGNAAPTSHLYFIRSEMKRFAIHPRYFRIEKGSLKK